MFVLVLQSQSPASISSFLSLSYALFFHSFPLSHSTLNHSMYFCSASFFTFLPMSFAFSLSFTIITIYFSYNLSACFFFFTRLFSFDLSFASKKKGLRKILSSQHRNVMKCFHCPLCTNLFFLN